MSALRLRADQADAVQAVERELASGRTRTLVVAPTGSGKSWIIAELVARARAQNRRALVLVHREELVDQLARDIGQAMPETWLSIEQAARRAAPLSGVVIGSVPTLGQRSRRRLDRLGAFGLVVIDEAHHSPAESFQRVFRRLGCFTPGGPQLVGFTGTSSRSDGVGLGHIFESIAYEQTLARLIAEGVLPQIRAYSIHTEVSLEHVRRRGEDFEETALADTVNTPARNSVAVRAYEAHAAPRQAIVFCVDRRHVRDMTLQFQLAGVPADAVTGDLPHAVRAERVRRFRSGQLRVLVNCQVLVEGIHVPALEAIVLARPTQSETLYRQMLGRATSAAGLTEIWAIDLVDLVSKHSVQTLATLAGLPPRVRFQGERLFDAGERLNRALTEAPWLAAAIQANRLVTVEDIVAATHAIDPLYVELPLPDALQRSRLAWVAVPPARWVLSAPTGTLTIEQTLLAYDVSWQLRGAPPSLLGSAATMEEAVQLGEAAARQQLEPRTLRMLDRTARWRARPASGPQKQLLDRYGIQYTEDTTAGAAALRLTTVLSRRFAGARRRALEQELITRQEVER